MYGDPFARCSTISAFDYQKIHTLMSCFRKFLFLPRSILDQRAKTRF